MEIYVITINGRVAEKAFKTEAEAQKFIDTEYGWVKYSACNYNIDIYKTTIE